MENEILLETEELLQRLVEAVEKLNSAPSEDTIIAFFALVAAWITIAFLLVERHEKNRPYLQISFELVRSTLACIVLRNTGSDQWYCNGFYWSAFCKRRVGTDGDTG